MVSELITITRAELTADASRALIGALNAELSALYPEPGANHFDLKPAQVSGQSGVFLIVCQDGTPAGCGAVRLIDAETGELKRMYVSPTMRGKGLGRRLVAALEAEARALGARRRYSKRASGSPPRSRSIARPGFSQFRSTGNAASPRKPASASARCCRAGFISDIRVDCRA